ncbi:hypothetical protein JX265_010781 [Neoarthrinium moseri]|uniref:Uncharacterized protein n=1 Tax=Neoarthrinium moseri TaxID=1658444 RepID=A0A9P9WDC1_9PEZI|nr:uncharacterized protein JN550_010653 [Neoarthrinium moseri]KAI1840223.1 hypothetical protein JX266_013590 [Neoarthrinium moseri]KAI1858113.1 hypothetical protein JX265_010781 [Neoarthrinium moseri]KAI1862022.1 hypothetical protein JN550_010653 [Neoarthrinium moseri]
MYYASLLGFEDKVRKVWADGSQLSIARGAHGNALNAVAIRGNLNIVRWIMQMYHDPIEILHMDSIAREVGANAKDIIFELCSRIPASEITERVLTSAAQNWDSGRAVMELLLEKKGDEIQITEGVITAAIENEYSGRELTELLLEKKGDQIQITEGVITATVGNL